MTPRRTPNPGSGSAGVTLVEVLVALVVLGIGILGFSRVFPTAMRSQVKSRMETTAGQYTNEKHEELRGLLKTNTLLSIGRHPSTGFETLGSGAWQRYYVIAQMPAPLDSLLRVDVTVKWQASKPESVRMAGYLFP